MIECQFAFGPTVLTGPPIPVEHVPSGWVTALEGSVDVVDKAKHPRQAESALGAFDVVGLGFGVGDDGFVLKEKTDGSSPIDDS
tara:strand:+ start:363 stop:614 length:252 start_codon:yes stop_codon:yes gene_type:complete